MKLLIGVGTGELAGDGGVGGGTNHPSPPPLYFLLFSKDKHTIGHCSFSFLPPPPNFRVASDVAITYVYVLEYVVLFNLE